MNVVYFRGHRVRGIRLPQNQHCVIFNIVIVMTKHRYTFRTGEYLLYRNAHFFLSIQRLKSYNRMCKSNTPKRQTVGTQDEIRHGKIFQYLGTRTIRHHLRFCFQSINLDVYMAYTRRTELVTVKYTITVVNADRLR